jgi:hypothetical protein
VKTSGVINALHNLIEVLMRACLKSILSDTTFQNIGNRLSKDLPPLLHQCETTVENNSWHCHQPVWQQTVNMVWWIQTICNQVSPRQIDKLKELVTKDQTRFTCLLLATLLHAIGKPKTICHTEAGTECRNFAQVSASMTRKLLADANFDGKIVTRVCEIVQAQESINEIINLVSSGDNHLFQNWQRLHEPIYSELLILGLAYTLSSHRGYLNPADCSMRVCSYRLLLGIS